MVAGATPVPLVGTPRRYDTIRLSLGFLGADSTTRCKRLFSEVSPGNLAGGGAGREGSGSGQRRVQGTLLATVGGVSGMLPGGHSCQPHPLVTP